MDSVHFLNIQYIFLRLYEIISGASVDVSRGPDIALLVWEVVAVVGIVLSVVLLTLIVYVRIRTIQVEHAGFHELEEKEHAQHRREALTPKNPQWDIVMSLSNSPNESDWRRAILEADIMLGAMLAASGYEGDTLGEQLKNANPLQFTTLDLAWEAHRMRNTIAHLGEAFPLSHRDAQATVDLYRRVFEEFDFI